LGTLLQGALADTLGLKWITATSGVLLTIGLGWRLSIIRRDSAALPGPRGPERVSSA
jgi:hypothetical protein